MIKSSFFYAKSGYAKILCYALIVKIGGIGMNTKVVKGTSKKGTEYYMLVIELVPGYEKKVFLDPADVKIIELYNANKNK